MKTLPSILLMLITIPAWAGPPLICQRFDIGSARSLSWKAGPDWHGADPSYNLANLTNETLSIDTHHARAGTDGNAPARRHLFGAGCRAGLPNSEPAAGAGH